MSASFSIILACDEAGGIGLKGDLPWRLKADLAYFKKTTLGEGNNAVIMGRKTWFSIPEKFRPLPGRKNIVLSSKKTMHYPEGVTRVDSLDDALEICQADNIDEVFVIGGGQVYAEALRHGGCDKIHLTAVRGSFACDTFFQTQESNWQLASETELQHEDSIPFTFCSYTRK
ncbi:MAG: dihydrofolate reductase [Planctomycetes bacterium]|jgi:dihydrofolate reductase|nr:dihydrofolate reductase [Planctomycetota bacterium]MBT4029422.1 dihydrofolate reductase [Planctomycetota bacterium]MBT4559965.1 dihydrofolate reductase [Planctomycetota bacterium]MBT5100667.1 dihydrofolate reductase [Planctomycetota bacterium]MBT5120547.1 dihydrofolate reductase [Planctomycetota bacterium]